MDVLIVEDEPLVRGAVARDLREAGLRVAEAASAESALATAAEAAASGGPPSVVVTGLHLGPGMDGLALAVEVLRRWPEVGVVYITCHPDALDGRLLGPREHYIVKPFAPGTLLHAVRHLMPAWAVGWTASWAGARGRRRPRPGGRPEEAVAGRSGPPVWAASPPALAPAVARPPDPACACSGPGRRRPVCPTPASTGRPRRTI
jgi:CheY-like chemotaxis protein